MATTRYCDQITLWRASGQAANEDAGHLIRQYFNYTVPVATIAIADTLMVGVIPNGARFYGGIIWVSAAGGAAVASVGTYTSLDVASAVSTTNLGALTDMTLVTSQAFGNTQALRFGETFTQDEIVGFLVADAPIPNAAVIQGYLEYTI